MYFLSPVKPYLDLGCLGGSCRHQEILAAELSARNDGLDLVGDITSKLLFHHIFLIKLLKYCTFNENRVLKKPFFHMNTLRWAHHHPANSLVPQSVGFMVTLWPRGRVCSGGGKAGQNQWAGYEATSERWRLRQGSVLTEVRAAQF